MGISPIFYDDLMRDVPYDQWLNFFQNKVKKNIIFLEKRSWT